MKSMRLILPFVFLLMSSFCYAQDKIYMNDNSLLEGKIVEVKESKLELLFPDQSKKTIFKKDIAVIIYSDGRSEVIDQNETKKNEKAEDYTNKDWMLGTNILLPLEGMLGFSIEKRITKRYSIRVGESFYWNNYRGFGFYTSLLNNFYIGKGKIKWVNSIGLNLDYSEVVFYPFEGPYLMTADYIMPYPQNGFNSQLNLEFTLGTGMHVDVTRHFAFSTQLFASRNLGPYNAYTDLDFINTGFCFYYKF